MSENVDTLRALQAQLRQAKRHEYLRGVYNGIELALAILEGLKFNPLEAEKLFEDRPPKKHDGRPHTTVCARCRKEEKLPGKSYCRECYRALARESAARCRERRRNADGATAEPAAEPEAPKPQKHGGNKNAILDAPAAPEVVADPDAKGSPLFEKMVEECKKRNYDPDLMLGLARVLPRIGFEKNGSNTHLTLRRPKEDDEA